MATVTEENLLHNCDDGTLNSNFQRLFRALVDVVEKSRNEVRATSQDDNKTLPELGSDSEGGGSSDEDIDHGSSDLRVEAVEDLNKELKSLEIDEQVSTLETLIVIVEYYVKSGDVEGFRKNIRRPDNFLLSRPRPKISDLKTMAENMEHQKLIFRAVMVHKAIAALLKYEYKHKPDQHHQQANIVTPNDAVSGIIMSMVKVFHLCVSTENDDIERNSYVIHVIPILYDMLTNLREIRHANRKYRADCEAWGLLFIALVHGTLAEYIEMQNVLDTSVNAMMRRFKKKSSKHFIYGLSCVALAIAEVSVGGGNPSEMMNSGVKSIQECADVPIWDAKVNVVNEVRKLSDIMGDYIS